MWGDIPVPWCRLQLNVDRARSRGGARWAGRCRGEGYLLLLAGAGISRASSGVRLAKEAQMEAL